MYSKRATGLLGLNFMRLTCFLLLCFAAKNIQGGSNTSLISSTSGNGNNRKSSQMTSGKIIY